MTQDELRTEIIAWLRSNFAISIEAEREDAIYSAVHAEFSVDSGIWVSEGAFVSILRELKQRPEQTDDGGWRWHPKTRLLLHRLQEIGVAQ